jgi:ATP-binding cassette subfamily F protein 3
VYKKISVLSGGEKSRVALAKILLVPSNLLLLDEPTNHLDLTSKEILLQSLQEYEGTVLFISHDRYFMDQLGTKVLELKDGVLTPYLCNYSTYLQKAAGTDSQPEPQSAAPAQTETAFYKSKEQKKIEALQRQQQSKWKKEILKPLQEVEEKVAQGEARLKELEKILADDRTYAERDSYARFIDEYNQLKLSLESLYRKWEELQKKREEMEARLALDSQQ